MNEVQEGAGPGKKRKSTVLWAAVALIATVGVLYGASRMLSRDEAAQGLAPLAKGDMAKLTVADGPGPETAIKAVDADGKPVTLADFKGEVVVVNLWATWCAPCVREMPELARLQAAYEGKPVKVVAVSLDKGEADIAKAKAFIADKKPLRFYHGDYAVAFEVTPPAGGLPTTILYDRTGRERARLAGGADWSRPDAKAVIDRLLAMEG